MAQLLLRFKKLIGKLLLDKLVVQCVKYNITLKGILVSFYKGVLFSFFCQKGGCIQNFH